MLTAMVMAFLISLLPPPAAADSPRGLLAALMTADNANDLDAVMAVYAEDAVLLPPHEQPVTGKAAIRARYTKMFASTRMEVRFEVDDEGADGGLGFLRGRTIGRRVSTDGHVDDLTGKFVMVLKRHGGWAISSLIWNPDR